MKKILALVLVVAMVLAMTLSLVACDSSGDPIVIWTFTDELTQMIEEYYSVEYPDVEIEVITTPVSSMATKLDNAIATGTNLPDMVALEEEILSKYMSSGALASLENIATEENTANMYDYTLDAATDDDGNVLGMAWQATPGAFFYRRSMAIELWGTDDPTVVQSHVDTWDNFIETAADLKSQIGVDILSSLTEPCKVFYAQRDCGWVDSSNKLTISSNLYEGDDNLYDVLYALQGGTSSALYVNEQSEWNSGWFADMSSDNVFGFFLSSWGLHYNLKEYSVNTTTGFDTAGDWGVVQGPDAFSDGGTWLSVLSTSDKQEECEQIIEYFTCNEDFLTSWAESTGDYMNNKSVMSVISEDYSEAFLGGQNHYEILYAAAEELEGNYLTKYDSTINATFQEWAVVYAMGTDSMGNIYTKDAALEQFKLSVLAQYTTITV